MANCQATLYLKWKTTSILSQMEDDINFISNGRRPQLYFKWKTTSILFQMEDDLNLFSNGRRPKLSFHMEVNLYILLLQKRRQLKIFNNKKDDINFLKFLKIFQLLEMS